MTASAPLTGSPEEAEATTTSVKPTVPSPSRKSRRPTSRKQNLENSHQNHKSPALSLLSPDERRDSIASNAPSVLLHPQITLTCYIPSTCVGAVIGRRGSTILQIQKHAQQFCSSSAPPSSPPPVRVSIVGENETDVPYTYSPLDWSNPLWAPVVIRAEPAAALAAAERLEEILHAELSAQAETRQHLSPSSTSHMDEVVMDVSLSRSKHAVLVGKKGLNLMSLSADNKVRIMVPRKDLRHDVVQFEGSFENVTNCFQQALQFLVHAESRKRKQQQQPADTTGPPMSAATTILPVAVLPPQTKLRSVARKTETTIQKQKTDDGDWELVISGTNVSSAVEMLEKWNSDQADKETTGDTGTKSTTPRNNNRKGRGGKNKRNTGNKSNDAFESMAQATESTPPSTPTG